MALPIIFKHNVILSALLFFSPLVLGLQRKYTIVNNCPTEIDMFAGKYHHYLMNAGEIVVKALDEPTLFFQTRTNGGSEGDYGTRVGFYDEENANKYYIMKDWEAFNVGVQIYPSHQEVSGYCPSVLCDSIRCDTAFDYPPSIPVSNDYPPQKPLFSCPFPGVDYTIVFCPSGSYPGDWGRATAIHPNFNPEKCMDVRGAVYADGTPVQIYDCNGSGAQKWVSNRDFTKFRVAGTDYCLDMGGEDRNGVGMKIWTCIDHIGAQEWFSSNRRINHEGLPYCLDLPNGVTTNGNQLQLWECENGNYHQVWNRGS